MIDLEMLIKRWKWIAAFDVLFILLLKTPFGVSDDTGNTAWLKFPFLPVSIGPAEVVKITFIILLAWQLQWLREEKRDLRSFSAAFYVGGHTLGIAGLYFVISGDMGNALMFLLIFRGDVLRGRLCPAVVRTAFRRQRGPSSAAS